MKKLNVTKAILWAITVLGGYLVGEGILTGEELSEIQNVIGMILGGGGISIIGVLTILQAIPKQLITEGYKKVVSQYGAEKVDGALDVIYKLSEDLQAIRKENAELKLMIEEDREQRNKYING